MAKDDQLDIFLSAAPGHEAVLAEEARARNLGKVRAVEGGVMLRGGWREVWRANLQLRGAGRVLARIASFEARHLAELDRRARQVAWGGVLRPDVAFDVEVTCRRSRIYHSDAAAERIAQAIGDELGAPRSDEADVRVVARIENDRCTLAVDTSGEALYKRGFKQAVAKAPMRETLAAMFLRQCGHSGGETVLDPMCGSGTFVIEAAEIAAGLAPGRSRRFAFERLATFDKARFADMRAATAARATVPAQRFYGRDRDAGAIRMSRENAERAGVGAFTVFEQREMAELERPPGAPGLVILNPPYGTRIGETRELAALYRTIGRVLAGSFTGWRVGLVTSEPRLAEACGLPFMPPPDAVLSGGLRLRLYATGPLP